MMSLVSRLSFLSQSPAQLSTTFNAFSESLHAPPTHAVPSLSLQMATLPTRLRKFIFLEWHVQPPPAVPPSPPTGPSRGHQSPPVQSKPLLRALGSSSAFSAFPWSSVLWFLLRLSSKHLPTLKSTIKTNGSLSQGRTPPPDSPLTCVFFQLTCVCLPSEPPSAYCNLVSVYLLPTSPNPVNALWLYVTYWWHGIWHCWRLAHLP